MLKPLHLLLGLCLSAWSAGVLAATPATPATPGAPAPNSTPAVETIVLVRHGEKPPADLGQLTCQGLNRALALPDVLLTKYGTPDFIFAPITRKKTGHTGPGYSYIRPLMTIEPTAIRAGLPVDTRYAFDDIKGLQRELTGRPYRNKLIFVAWEHYELFLLVKNLLHTFKADPAAVPEWAPTDFDSIYIVKLSTADGHRTATFEHDQEGLNGLSTDCPGAKPK